MLTFTREALYARVWAEPIPTLVLGLCVPPTALRQACRDADIPLPGRGHWTRLRAGKPVVMAALPPRGPAMAQTITLAPPGLCGVEAWKAELESPLPDPPVFEEPIDVVHARVRAQLGAIAVSPHLDRACADIRRLLAADDQRRDARSNRRSVGHAEPSLFDNAFERRRLRLLNSLAFGLGRVGAHLDIGGPTGRDLAVLVGRQRVCFTLDAPGALPVQGEWSAHPGPLGPLVVTTMPGRNGVDATSKTWRDGHAAPLESQLAEIAADLLVTAEARYRTSEVAAHAYRVDHRAQLAQDLTDRQTDAVRRRDEREALKAEARRTRLRKQAEDWRTARDIRSFVAEVAADPAVAQAPGAGLHAWQAWALAEADALDPSTRGGPEPWSAEDDLTYERPCGCGARCERGCGCGLRRACECDCPGEQDRDDEHWLRFPDP